jgi:hypothetical protein
MKNVTKTSRHPLYSRKHRDKQVTILEGQIEGADDNFRAKLCASKPAV